MAGLTNQEAAVLLSRIDSVPVLQQVGVAFIGRGVCQQLRDSPMPFGLKTWLVLEEATAEDVEQPEIAPAGSQKVERESKLLRELLLTGLSCGSAALAGFATAGSVAAAPVTAGMSTTVTVLAYAGLVATSAQCGIGAGRVYNELFNPTGNDYLDSEQWYQTTSNLLDAVSIAGGVAALGSAAQTALRLSRSSGKPIQEVLKGLGRNERKQLAQDLAKYSGQAATRRQFVRLARRGKIPKIIRQEAINQAIVNDALNAVSAGLTMIGSGTSGLAYGVVVYFAEDE